LNWKNNFDKHHFDILSLFEARWTKASTMLGSKSDYNFLIPELDMGPSPEASIWGLNGTSASTAVCGVVGRINYDYDQKYLLELAGRYDATYFYAPGKRTDFFPSLSAGWRISEEPFMAFSRNTIDNLKLRASYGKSGLTTGDEFAYMNYYKIGAASYVWGTGDEQVRQQGIYADKESNPDLTWQSVWKTNIGFDLNMWNGLVGLEIDYYHEKRTNKVLNPTAGVTSEYGINLAQENAGIDLRRGIDISLKNQTKAGDFTLSNVATFTFTRLQQIEIHENQGSLYNSRKRQTGLPGSQLWGYQSAGLFKDMEEIQNWAFQDNGTLPGDIKYIDQNHDSKIDGEDIVHIGLSQIPEIMFGYNFRAEWKGFDAGFFIQGTGRSNYNLSSADKGVIHPFARNKARTEMLQSWTTDNPNAAYPRLRSSQFAKNYEASDFWIVNSSYIKLKSIDLGYNLKPEWMKATGLSRLRIYANFYNVWTIFSKTSKDFDPESQQYSAYPQQFISTIGLSATF
jgi:TonB-linked SusC/RagA family outer membrane protein